MLSCTLYRYFECNEIYEGTELTLWSWALLERPLDVRPLDSFPAFHGTRRFNTAFTGALHLFLSWARPIQSTSPHPTSSRSILILSTHLRLGLHSGLFPSGFPTNNLYALFSPNSCYIPSPFHPHRLDYSNYTWRRVQITKLLVMQFSPFSTHLIPLRSKYPPQYPVLKHLQSMFLR
jgi:hypothetical protein